MKSSISRREFLRRGALLGSGLMLGTSGTLTGRSSTLYISQRFDTIIRNGLVYSGEGTQPFTADIGIRDGRISALGSLGDSADRLIDVHGLAVSPGFIDLHSHTDTNLLTCPQGDSRIFQGITTEAGGNCGDSPFPAGPYENADQFFGALNKSKTGINYCSFTGQGSLRSAVIGNWAAPATDEQIRDMKRLLDRQLSMGSIGLSCGLEYAPGAYASNRELVELLKVVAVHDGLFAIHMRNEDDRVEEAISETVDMAKQAGVRLQISHLKAQNPANWHKGPAMLGILEQAQRDGMDVAFDRYPYIAFSTGLSSFLPLSERQGSAADVIARLSDPAKATELEKYANSRIERLGGPANVIISACVLPANKETCMGRTLEQCASVKGVSLWEFIRNLLVEERLRTDIIAFAMSEDNVKMFLSHPLGMPASDGSVYSPRGPLSANMPHPRSYGTFPRFLGKYCREEKMMNLSQAVRKITSLPASRLGLKNRGLLIPGYAADLVVFDPDTIIDTATFDQPHRFARGIHHVWVNGVHTISEGQHTGVLAGNILQAKG